jgi:hypothetical protein
METARWFSADLRNRNSFSSLSIMEEWLDSNHPLVYGALIAVLLAMWLVLKIVKKIFVAIVFIIVLSGIGLIIYFKYL